MHMNKEQTAADLRGAADVIRERGWHQGSLIGRGGRVCAVGALSIQAGVLGLMQAGVPGEMCAEPVQARFDRVESSRKALCEVLGLKVFYIHQGDMYNGDQVPDWNDAEGRTVDDVLNGLEKAAIWAEEQA